MYKNNFCTRYYITGLELSPFDRIIKTQKLKDLNPNHGSAKISTLVY